VAGVQGSECGFRVVRSQGLGQAWVWVRGSGFGCRIEGLGLRLQGARFMVQGWFTLLTWISVQNGPPGFSRSDSSVCSPPKIRRGAIAKVNTSDFRGNARQKWRFQDVEYLRVTPRPGLLFTIAPHTI